MTRDVLLTVAAGLLVLTYLLIESRGPDQMRLARVHGALQAIQLHDAELNRDVLLVRSGLLAHYDSLTSIGRKLADDLNVLRSEGATLDRRATGPIADEIAALDTALSQKLTLIEYLKSDNAVLRNSIAYFTESMRARGEIGREGRPAVEAAALSHAVMHFIGAPEPDVNKQAAAVLARVARLAQRSQDLKPITAHGELVLELLPRLDTLLAQIVASPTVMRAERLQRAIMDSAGNTETRAQRFRLLLYLVALLLLGYVVLQVTRLRARTRELRRQEMQLIQANKMTSLGTLVSGVAHEVNNPNQLVLMNSGVLASTWDDVVNILDSHRREGHEFSIGGLPYDEMRRTVPPLIRQIGDGARRIERIILDLKDFARPRSRVTERYELNDVVHRALRLLTHVIQRRTDHFQVELGPDLPPLSGDSQQVEQVVVNLVINALEALPDRTGAVKVTTRFDAETDTAVLEVRDDGVGIPREQLSRLGEPFFTTKAASGGTGLGVAIASSLVRLHNGRLRIASEPGNGTRAIVELPYSPHDSEPDPSRTMVGVGT
jgi:signal transduction histidine kinase